MRLNLFKPLKSDRSCGDCTACCTTLALAALNKPINVRCQHVCTAGCGIYNDRPEACQNYRCAWHLGLLPEKFRPDQSGIVWSFESTAAGQPTILQAFLLVDQVPLQQIEYQLAKIQQNVRDRIVCRIVPRGLSCKVFGAFSYVQIKPSIWLAEREVNVEQAAR
jgi:hypothetical protein